MRWLLLLTFASSAPADECDRVRAMLEYNVKRPEAPGATEKIAEYRAELRTCEETAKATLMQVATPSSPTLDPIVQRVLDDSRAWQRAASAYLCGLRNERAGYLKEIAVRRKYSQLGGVEDMNAVYELQQSVREADESIKVWIAGMSKAKAKPISCGDKVIREIVRCNEANTDNDTCSEQINLLVQATNAIAR